MSDTLADAIVKTDDVGEGSSVVDMDSEPPSVVKEGGSVGSESNVTTFK